MLNKEYYFWKIKYQVTWKLYNITIMKLGFSKQSLGSDSVLSCVCWALVATSLNLSLCFLCGTRNGPAHGFTQGFKAIRKCLINGRQFYYCSIEIFCSCIFCTWLCYSQSAAIWNSLLNFIQAWHSVPKACVKFPVHVYCLPHYSPAKRYYHPSHHSGSRLESSNNSSS